MLGKMFRLCQPFDGTRRENIATLVETLLGNFETVVQYNRDGGRSNLTTGALCRLMTDSTRGSELHRQGEYVARNSREKAFSVEMGIYFYLLLFYFPNEKHNFDS